MKPFLNKLLHVHQVILTLHSDASPIETHAFWFLIDVLELSKLESLLETIHELIMMSISKRQRCHPL